MFKNAPIPLRSLIFLLFAAGISFGSLYIALASPHNDLPAQESHHP